MSEKYTPTTAQLLEALECRSFTPEEDEATERAITSHEAMREALEFFPAALNKLAAERTKIEIPFRLALIIAEMREKSAAALALGEKA